MNKREYKTRGFIIARRKQGETSKVITVLTKDFGRRSIIVKSARSTNSRTGGVAEPFMLVDIVAREGRSFDSLKDVSLVSDYKILEQSLSGFGMGNVLVEVLDKVSRGQDDLDVYGLLIDYLDCWRRNGVKLANYEKVMIYLSSFIMSILAISGRLPVVTCCCVCGLSNQAKDVVMLPQGVCHRSCLESADYYMNIDQTMVWWLEKIVTQSCDQLLGHDCDSRTSKNMFEISLFLFGSFFERELKSSFFLDNIFNKEEG